APLDTPLGVYVEKFEPRQTFPGSGEIPCKHFLEMLSVEVSALEYAVLTKKLNELLSADRDAPARAVHDGKPERKREFTHDLAKLRVLGESFLIQYGLDFNDEFGFGGEEPQSRQQRLE